MSDKPKCPVFGCTIPRGIPHEHPAGVSVVMRDPVAPLSADERAELESFRRERDWLTREGLKAFSKHSTYVVPEDAPLVPGRKLRDALLMAGIERRPETEHQFATVFNGKEFVADHMTAVDALEQSTKRDRARHELTIAASNVQMAAMVEIMNAPLRQLADDIRGMEFGKDHAPAPRRTLAQSVGTIMSWLLGIPCLLLMCFVIGHQLGWWL